MRDLKKPETVTIEVTQEDIDAGFKCSSRKCPIARAMLRAFPEATEVLVGIYSFDIYRDYEPVVQYAELPLEAQRFIDTFDKFGWRRVKPFSFEVAA